MLLPEETINRDKICFYLRKPSTEINMFLKENRSTPALHVLARCAFGIAFLVPILVRISLFHVVTGDDASSYQWYIYIQTHGGFAALKDNFSNYNVPYLYLLAVATYFPSIPELIAVRIISVLFDIVLGIFTYLILRLQFKRPSVAIIGTLVVLCAPTVFINSAAWGQLDASYTAFCLGSAYFLLKGRPGWACAFFGLAISFKLQAIFFLPVLLVLLLRKKLSVKHLVLIPVIFLLILLPAFIAGRNAVSLLSIYAGQASTGGMGGWKRPSSSCSVPPSSGKRVNCPPRFPFHHSFPQFTGVGPFNLGGLGTFMKRGDGNPVVPGKLFTLDAPSFYQWIPANAPDYWKWIGIVSAGLFVVLVGLLLWRSKQQIDSAILLKVILVFAIAIPFLLPEMHERYFYLADVVSIMYAFNFPRLFFVAVIMQLCSLLSYAPFLIRIEVVPFSYVAFGVLVIAIVTFVDLVLSLYPNLRGRFPVLC